MKTFFVSDLHIFSRRSQAHRHEERIHQTAKQARTFVLGGDIFDFRWSTLPSVDHSVEAAIRWLDELISPHPWCDFHFVLGNHDSHHLFIKRLERFASGISNLQWHPYYLRLGHSMFLHGDVADRRMGHRQLTLRRAAWLEESKRRGPVSNALYDVAIGARLHKLAALKNRHPRVASRILAYLEDVGHGPRTGVEHVYFGHTHTAMSNYEYAGLRFHNGGAPIKGLDFRIVQTSPLSVAPRALTAPA